MKFKLLTVAGTLLLSGAVVAFAHGGATGVVKERMDAMGAMGDVVKSLSAMMRGETTYDATAVRKGAEVIQSHSGEAMIKLFPEHSVEGPSEAKHEIWTEWQEFTALADQLQLFATGLGNAADNGLAHSGDAAGMGNMMGHESMMGGAPTMMGAAGHMADPEMIAQMPADGVFNMVAQTCSACHSKFRVEKN